MADLFFNVQWLIEAFHFFAWDPMKRYTQRLMGLLSFIALSLPFDAFGFNPRQEDRLIPLTASDGATLPIRLWGQQNSPARIILGIHGFSDYARGFAHLLPVLDLSGQSLLIAFDQRGFGENPSRGQWAGIDRMLADFHDVLLFITERYPGRPIHVIGESMGAALLLISMHHPKTEGFFSVATPSSTSQPSGSNRPRAVIMQSVLLAPAVWGWSTMPWYQTVSLKLLAQLLPDLRLSSKNAKRLGVRPTDDPAVAEHLAKDPFMLRDIPVSMIAGLTELMTAASLQMPKPGHRSLVMIGTHDEVIPPTAYCEWLNRQQPSASSRWFVQQEGFHMLTRQKRAETILAGLQDFLNQQAASPTQAQLPTKELKC
ncbi:MAG: alpha/beta fold hydrolase [Betaproteobacteria bacterium]|nr:alpha/beta fold hydrolase [Betaproteobacteria bacterium]